MSRNDCPECYSYAPLGPDDKQVCSSCGHVLTSAEACPQGPCDKHTACDYRGACPVYHATFPTD